MHVISDHQITSIHYLKINNTKGANRAESSSPARPAIIFVPPRPEPMYYKTLSNVEKYLNILLSIFHRGGNAEAKGVELKTNYKNIYVSNINIKNIFKNLL